LRRVVKSGAGDVCQNSSDSIFISVIPAVSNNIIASSQVICENTLPDPLSGSTPVGGTGSYLYKWHKSPNGVDAWMPANPSGESINYSPEIMLSKAFFRRDVYSGPDNTCTNISNILEIDIQAAISNNFLINGSQISSCYNVQSEAVQGSGSLTGGDGTVYNFLWQESNDMILWSPGSQLNSLQDYQPQALTDSIYLRRIVSSGLCRDTTEILKVKINPLPQISSLISNASGRSICEDENVSLLYTISAGSFPYNLKYTDNITAGELSASLDSNNGTFPVAIVGGSPSNYKFQLTELVDANACKASDVNLSSFLIELDVFKAANPRIGMQDTVEVCGNTVQLNASFPDAGNGIWRASNGIVSIADPANLATQASFQLSPFNKITSHFYYVESTPGCGEKMDSVIVVFYEQPEDAVITTQSAASPFVVFLVDNITLTSLPPSAGSGMWSINQGSALINSQTDSSAFINHLEIDQENKVVYSIINGVCDIKSTSLLIERKDVKIYQGFSPNGDGINDFLFAEGIDKSGTELSYTLTIFNNSGAFIREVSEKDIYPGEINAIWDGIASNGKLAAEGTYYYIFQITYKGNVLKPYKNFFVIKSE
jgi:gliding motility-associated-like protein